MASAARVAPEEHAFRACLPLTPHTGGTTEVAMDWRSYDRWEQEQLEICRALIEDATKDTTLWLQGNASAEERVHVLEIQTGLANLTRIIERRMDRHKEVKDDWEYSETVSEVLLNLDKARELRGNIVGKGLARLADRLPRELPGSKVRLVTQAPAPITPLSGTGGWTPRQPKPTEVPANPPANFPGDLWPQTNVILLEARKQFPQQTHTLELCRHIIYEMTPLFCEAVKLGKMKAGAVLREGCGGMEDLLHSLLVYNDSGIPTGFGLSNEAFRLGTRVRESDEWLALAKAINSVGEDRLRTGGNQTESSDAQNSEKTRQSTARKPEKDEPEVAKRTTLVRNNPTAPARDMCEIFDRHNVQLPAKWKDAGFPTWSKAYIHPVHRKRIDVMISKDKRRS